MIVAKVLADVGESDTTARVELDFGDNFKQRRLTEVNKAFDDALERLGEQQVVRDEIDAEQSEKSVSLEIQIAIWNSLELNTDAWYEQRRVVLELIKELQVLTSALQAAQFEVDTTFALYNALANKRSEIRNYRSTQIFVAEKVDEKDTFYADDTAICYFQNDTTGGRLFISDYVRRPSADVSESGQFVDPFLFSPELSYHSRALQPYVEKFKPICRTGVIVEKFGARFQERECSVRLDPANCSTRPDLSINKEGLVLARGHRTRVLNDYDKGDRVVVVLDSDYDTTGKGVLISFEFKPFKYVRCGGPTGNYAFGRRRHSSSDNATEKRTYPCSPFINQTGWAFNAPSVPSQGRLGIDHIDGSVRTHPALPRGLSLGDITGQDYCATEYQVMWSSAATWHSRITSRWRNAHPDPKVLPYDLKYNNTTDLYGATVNVSLGPVILSNVGYGQNVWPQMAMIRNVYRHRSGYPLREESWRYPLYEIYWVGANGGSAPLGFFGNDPSLYFVGVEIRIHGYQSYCRTAQFSEEPPPLGRVFTHWEPDARIFAAYTEWALYGDGGQAPSQPFWTMQQVSQQVSLTLANGDTV